MIVPSPTRLAPAVAFGGPGSGHLSQKDTPQVGGAQIIRFSGSHLKKAGRNGIWVTHERIPAKVGGLGEVSKTIPDFINQYGHNKDIRVIEPLLAPMEYGDYEPSTFYNTNNMPEFLQSGAFRDTGHTLTLTDPEGQREDFQLLRRPHAPMNAPDAYALVNNQHFALMRRKADAVPFQPTGLVKYLLDPYGKRQQFELWQKFEAFPGQEQTPPDKRKGTWVYAVRNPMFERLKDPYPWNLSPKQVEGMGPDGKTAMFNVNMMFNRAVAAFLPELNASAPDQPGTNVSKFDGDAGFVIANDWMGGPLLNELPDDYKVGKLFMAHNTYDEPKRQDTVDRVGLKVPDYMARYSRQTGEPMSAPNRHFPFLRRNSLKGVFSPFTAGIASSDTVIINSNFADGLFVREKRARYIPFLRQKKQDNQVLDMHHPLSQTYSPTGNPHLRKDGFIELPHASTKAGRQAAMKRFKQVNQRALQQKLGLRQDDAGHDYIMMNWIARYEPNQKGFYMVMAEAEGFLRTHPDAQLVIVGNSGGNPMVDRWIKDINAHVAADPDLQGRLYVRNEFVSNETVVQINAGSDFTLQPSLYEPYGLTHLEAMSLGSVPIVHGVDGNRATVSDPDLEKRYKLPGKGPNPAVWSNRQTGVLMRLVDVIAYQRARGRLDNIHNALMDHEAGKPLPTKMQPVLESAASLQAAHPTMPSYMLAEKLLAPKDAQALAQGNGYLREAMERAYQLSKDDKRFFEVRTNGQEYLAAEHNPKKIVARYEEGIDRAVRAAEKRHGSRFAAFG